MEIKKQQCLSYPGNIVNEDIATITSSSAWVLDGATGLNGKNLIHDESDAKWFVSQWNSYLLNNINNTHINLKEIIKNGIIEIKNKYYGLLNDKNVKPIDLPSSGISIIRWDSNYFEYFILGDCTILYTMDNNDAIEIKDTSLDHLDNEAISHMKKLIVTSGLPMKEARKSVNDILVNNRLLMNTVEGYWILGFDDNAIDHCLYNKILIKNKHIKTLLMSDGFSALFNKYKCIDKNNFFNIIDKEETLESLYLKLREIEDEDEEGIKYTRFKKSDDASAIYISISN